MKNLKQFWWAYVLFALSIVFVVGGRAIEEAKPTIPAEHQRDFFKAAAQWNATGAPLQQALIDKRKVMEADCAKSPAYQLGDGANGDPECVAKPKPAEAKKK